MQIKGGDKMSVFIMGLSIGVNVANILMIVLFSREYKKHNKLK